MTDGHVCTWCSGVFAAASLLRMHWLQNPDCNRNRKVSNPLQSKYGMAGGIENIPGEQTINRVRAEGCEHPENLREPLKTSMEADGLVIGFRCGHCYTEQYNQISD